MDSIINDINRFYHTLNNLKLDAQDIQLTEIADLIQANNVLYNHASIVAENEDEDNNNTSNGNNTGNSLSFIIIK